jgi:hypothetical protein
LGPVVASAPSRITLDGLSTDFVETNLHRVVSGAGGGDECLSHTIWVPDCPLQRLHAAHAPARHGMKLGDLQ